MKMKRKKKIILEISIFIKYIGIIMNATRKAEENRAQREHRTEFFFYILKNQIQKQKKHVP